MTNHYVLARRTSRQFTENSTTTRWQLIFGSFDRDDVTAELHHHLSNGANAEDFQIIASPTDPGQEQYVGQLNAMRSRPTS